MQYREQQPSAALAAQVKCFWSIEHDPDGPVEPELVLPDGCPEIVFNFADRFQKINTSGAVETQAATIVSGQLRSHIYVRRTGKVSLFGIRFQPFGAFAFLGMPLNELNDQVLSLDTVIGSRCLGLEQQLAESADFETRVFIAERALRLCRSEVRTPHFLQPMVSDICASGGRISVDEIRNAFGLNERRLQREFAHWVGISPKAFSRIVRFQTLVRSIERAAEPDLLGSALDLGYYDQSHMIREFNEFAGKTPLAYFRETHQLSELFTAGS